MKCSSCGEDMIEAGDVPFRVGGTGGGMHLLLGNWAELSEEILGLDVFLCRKCGKVELFADQRAQDEILRK